MVPCLGSFSRLIIFQREKNKNKTPSRLIKRAQCSRWGKQNLQAWLIPSFNYPVHLVSCDPGLRQVTCTTERQAGQLLTYSMVQGWKTATQADSSFNRWELERRAVNVILIWEVLLMPRASLNLIIKIIVFEKLVEQPAPVRTPSLEQRPETPEMKVTVRAVRTHGVLRKPQLSVMLSDSWYSPGTPLLDCLMLPGQSSGVFCHHKMTPETSSAGKEKGPGKLTLFLPPHVGDSFVLRWLRKVGSSSCYQASSQSFWGHMSQSGYFLSWSTFKVKELETWLYPFV